MIRKIISGAQTGADRAALDFAIEAGIPHGGWVSKGRKAEDGDIPNKYGIHEMPTSNYLARTKQNIIDSDGTLIISHGKLSGGSRRTKKVAKEYKRPCLHIDLNKTNAFISAGKVINWIATNGIEILNIAGPRASKDPEIYEETFKLLKAVYYMDIMDEEMPDPRRVSPLLPRTLEEALKSLAERIPLKEQVSLARLPEKDLIYVHPKLGAYIRDNFELAFGNHALIDSCRKAAGEKTDLTADEASFLIIRKLWEKAKSKYSLKVVQKDGIRNKGQ